MILIMFRVLGIIDIHRGIQHHDLDAYYTDEWFHLLPIFLRIATWDLSEYNLVH